MQESVTRLLVSEASSVSLRDVDTLSDTIVAVNGLFLDTKMLVQAYVVNVYSTKGDPVKQVSGFSLGTNWPPGAAVLTKW
jgi:hypothetical protein